MDDLKVLKDYCAEWGPCRSSDGPVCMMFGEEDLNCPDFKDPEKVKEYADIIRKMKAKQTEPGEPDDIYAGYRQHLHDLPEEVEILTVIFGRERVIDFLQVYAVLLNMNSPWATTRDLVSFMKEFGYGQQV